MFSVLYFVIGLVSLYCKPQPLVIIIIIMATQGNQELLVVRDKVGKTPPPSWARGKQVHGMWYFSLQCFDTVGWATGRAFGL